MSELKRPARLDISDMPKDKQRSLGGLRQALCASFNYCRKYPVKMAFLKEVIGYTYKRIDQWEKEHAAEHEALAKERIEAQAKQYGLDVDGRKSSENMQKELDDALEKRKQDEIKAVEPQETQPVKKEVAKDV